jgi:hypothetical protein
LEKETSRAGDFDRWVWRLQRFRYRNYLARRPLSG